jgi:hypothetical protein
LGITLLGLLQAALWLDRQRERNTHGELQPRESESRWRLRGSECVPGRQCLYVLGLRPLGPE